MAAGTDQPIPTPLYQRVEDFKQRYLPLLIWVVCAGICYWMLADRSQQTQYIGLAEAVQHEISAPTTGLLETVFVDLYQPVHIGDIVARLDDTELEARVERSHASIRQLRAQLIATRSQLQSTNESGLADWTTDLRRFQTDEEDRRLAALELRATIESDEIQLERLTLRVGRIGPLARDGIVDPIVSDEARLELAEVRKRLESNKALLVQTENEYRAARSRRHEFEANLPRLPEAEPALGPLREAITVESQRLREIESRRTSMALRSPIEGQVTQILCRQGQSVVPGQTVVTITDRTVRNIVTYLASADDRTVRENSPVLVSSLDRPGQVAESFVTRVGSSVEVLPERLWVDPTMPGYGRAVVIAALPKMGLRPGELLHIRFLDD